MDNQITYIGCSPFPFLFSDLWDKMYLPWHPTFCLLGNLCSFSVSPVRFPYDQESLWLYPAGGGEFILSPGVNMEFAAPLASSTFAWLRSLHTPQSCSIKYVSCGNGDRVNTECNRVICLTWGNEQVKHRTTRRKYSRQNLQAAMWLLYIQYWLFYVKEELAQKKFTKKEWRLCKPLLFKIKLIFLTLETNSN